MSSNKRIVVLGRDATGIDGLTRILEGAGYIVASTTNDGVAIDMVGSSSYDALLINRVVIGAKPMARPAATMPRISGNLAR